MTYSPDLSISRTGLVRSRFVHDFLAKHDLDRKVFVREEDPSAVVLVQPDEVGINFNIFLQNLPKR